MLTFVTAVVLSWGCAATTAPPPPPATVTRPPAGSPNEPGPELLDDMPVGRALQLKTPTAECRALFSDFRRTAPQLLKCEHDEDCAISDDCMSVGAAFKSTLEQKVRALGPCVEPRGPPTCPDYRATCYEKRCDIRALVRVD